jgi:hypothetical protein
MRNTVAMGASRVSNRALCGRQAMARRSGTAKGQMGMRASTWTTQAVWWGGCGSDASCVGIVFEESLSWDSRYCKGPPNWKPDAWPCTEGKQAAGKKRREGNRLVWGRPAKLVDLRRN